MRKYMWKLLKTSENPIMIKIIILIKKSVVVGSFYFLKYVFKFLRNISQSIKNKLIPIYNVKCLYFKSQFTIFKWI